MTLTRRFRLAPGFARLIGRERHAMPVIEGHFPDQSDRRSFLRLEGESCTLVLQDILPDGGISEERTEVSRAQGEVLMDVCAGRVVYERLPFEGGGGLDIEILRFASPLPCAFILLHFSDSMQADGFRPPLWFGGELSDEETCEPRRVALGAKPAMHDGTIQNAALESLLDHLESRSNRHGGGRGLGSLTGYMPYQSGQNTGTNGASDTRTGTSGNTAQTEQRPASQAQTEVPVQPPAPQSAPQAAPQAAPAPAPSAPAAAEPLSRPVAARPAEQGAPPPRQGQPARPRANPAIVNPAPSRTQSGGNLDDQDQIFDDSAGKTARAAPRAAARQG